MKKLIYLEDAINEIERWIGYLDKDMISRIQIGLERLPPAQPDCVEQRGEPMSKLDDTIASVAYILDTLMTYRNIVDSGDCNRCGKKNTCKYAPKLGQLVRYNCPFYKQECE